MIELVPAKAPPSSKFSTPPTRFGMKASRGRRMRAITAHSSRPRGGSETLDRDLELVQYAIAKKRLLAGLGPAGARELWCFIAEEGASAVAYVVSGEIADCRLKIEDLEMTIWIEARMSRSARGMEPALRVCA
jgi:hypothetical protein